MHCKNLLESGICKADEANVWQGFAYLTVCCEILLRKTRLFTCALTRTPALRGRDRSGGVAKRSGGMEAKAGTTDSPVFGSLRKQTDKKPPEKLKSKVETFLSTFYGGMIKK